MVASGLVLAFMISGSFTKRGSLSRRSVVMTAGRSTSSVSSPASTSRVTLAEVSVSSSFEANVACGRFHRAASIWPGLVVVVVDGLLAEDDEERLFAFHELEQHARDVERLERRVGNHVQRALRTHGQRIAQRGLAIRGSDGGDDDFVGAPALLDAQGFFDGDGIEGIDAELDAVERDARAIGLHADANVVVDDAFDCDENPSGL